MSIIKLNVGNTLHRKTIMANENQSIRAILEEAEVELGVGTISLDGGIIPRQDLDNPLGQYGLDPNLVHSLSSIVKADAAVNAVVAGGSVLVSTTLTLDVLKDMLKYSNGVFNLMGEEGEVLYSISYDDSANGSLDKYGAVFGTKTNSAGMASVTVEVPEDVASENVVDWFVEKYGDAILKLDQIEDQYDQFMIDAEDKAQKVKSKITVI